MREPPPTRFSAESLGELRDRLATHDGMLSLPEARWLRDRATELQPPLQELRLGIIHTYTSDLLDPWLELAAAMHGMMLSTYHAPYGISLQEAESGSALIQHRPDVTVLLLQRQDLHPGLGQPLASLTPDEQATLRQATLDRLRGLLGQFRNQPIGHLVITLLPAIVAPGLGRFDSQSERSEAYWWAQLKSELGAMARETLRATSFLDLDLLMQDIGRRNFFDLRFWYSAQYPFSNTAALGLAQQIAGIGAGLKSPKAKVIALDADNTLWGGVIGEDGLHGIRLGPEYPGNLYLAFQRRLLDYQQRGFILVLCSKNNAADVDQVLDEHPHQLIRHEHLAARRVNWQDKPENLLALAQELNLGLDSFVFVDDSAHECAAVRHRFPEVEVVQVPAKPLLVPFCLEAVARLEVLALTAEDQAKTQMYAQERQRRRLQQAADASGTQVEDYLASLQMVMRVGFDDGNHVPRLAQLTQKTNQFNLTTRRYDEQQIRTWIDADDRLVSHFSLSDTFGDSGIVGLALWRLMDDGQAELDSFLMSCRVIGRRAEQAFLRAQLEKLSEKGVREIVADFIPTAKNAPVRDFLPEQGFVQGDDGRFRLDLRNISASPADVPITIKVS